MPCCSSYLCWVTKIPTLMASKKNHFIIPMSQEFGHGKVEIVWSLSREDMNGLGLGHLQASPLSTPGWGWLESHLYREHLHVAWASPSMKAGIWAGASWKETFQENWSEASDLFWPSLRSHVTSILPHPIKSQLSHRQPRFQGMEKETSPLDKGSDKITLQKSVRIGREHCGRLWKTQSVTHPPSLIIVHLQLPRY